MNIRIESCPQADVKFHEYANLFPMMEGEAYKSFVEDVRQNGVREPIVFMGEAIIDGRNRYMAARDLGIVYPRTEYEGDDPLAFVISHNLNRRHLTESQRAMVASKLATMRQGSRTDLEHSESFPEVSQSDAAKLLNVSDRSIRTAKTVQEQGTPELVAAVESGKVSVSAAAVIAKQDHDTQRRIVAEDKMKKSVSDLRKAEQ
ncbi:hypothetical protein ACQKHB_23035, partial [Escherichia coli]|uniref:hypothetical protein n=1 Tax=Escherichia coli TaxID=562 RepID=UPI003CFCDF99